METIMQIPTMTQLQMMSDEEVAALNKKMARRFVRNVLIYGLVKGAIVYGLHRWAKSVADAN
ncbi:hypothetical protein SEA_LIBERTYBELL_38 [Streptomyces phage LibertyBell]|nr:hypothetical protein SEA_LIBERTYBELL_38 [Streptomyces phage LibertyBell]